MGGSLLQDGFLIRFTQKTQFARHLLPNRVCIWHKVFAYNKWQNLFLWSLSFIHRIQMPLLTVSQATNCSGLECWPILHILLYLGHVLKAPEGDLCGETKNISRRHMVPPVGCQFLNRIVADSHWQRFNNTSSSHLRAECHQLMELKSD